ncbi:MAG: hypothetical protein AAF587_41050 [Bacteroidota bacterium]
MKFLSITFAAVLTIGLWGFAVNPETTEADVPTELIEETLPIPGCDITIKAENKSLKKITIQFADSDVKTKTGTWSNIYYGAQNRSRCNKKNLVVNAKSSTLTNSCEMDLGCNFQRRYRFKLKSVFEGKTSYYTVYFPSSTSYCEKGKTVINLGNIGRHFR